MTLIRIQILKPISENREESCYNLDVDLLTISY